MMPNSQSSISVTKTTVGRLMPLSVVLTCVATLLQLIGYLTPAWFVYVGNQSSHSIGLYYQRVCTSHSCRITENNHSPVEMFDYQMEATLALIMCFITVVTLAKACWDCTIHPRLSVYLVAGCLCLISGILSFIASGKMAVTMINYHKQKSDNVHFPYSLLLTGLGGLFACVDASVIMTIMYRIRHKRPRDSSDSDSTISNEYNMPSVWVTSQGQSVLPPYDAHEQSTPPPYDSHEQPIPPLYGCQACRGHSIESREQQVDPPGESQIPRVVPLTELHVDGLAAIPLCQSRGQSLPQYQPEGQPVSEVFLNESHGQPVVPSYESEGRTEVFSCVYEP